MRESAKRFLKLRITQNDFPKSSTDELDNVERHLNQVKQVLDWLGIRVYEPGRQENDEIQWHLRKNPFDKLEDKMMIGIYEGHAFPIRDINKLAKLYSCVNCRERFTKTCNLQLLAKTCSQGKTIIDCPNKRVDALQTA